MFLIITRGNGILIPLFGVIGLCLGGYAAHALYYPEYMIPAALWTGFLAVLIYAFTIGKTITKAEFHEPTHQMRQVNYRNTFYWLGGKAWACLIATIAILHSVTATGTRNSTNEDNSTPGKLAFDAANSSISVHSTGKATHFGNNKVATNLASDFSKLSQEMREQGVEKRDKPPGFSLTKGSFLTYCLLNDEVCLFLLHVPDLRKFTGDAKDFMAESAWMAAQLLSSDLNPTPKKIVVGIRGSLLYDRVLVGVPGFDSLGDPMSGVRVITSADSKSFLIPYFAGKKTISYQRTNKEEVPKVEN